MKAVGILIAICVGIWLLGLIFANIEAIIIALFWAVCIIGGGAALFFAVKKGQELQETHDAVEGEKLAWERARAGGIEECLVYIRAFDNSVYELRGKHIYEVDLKFRDLIQSEVAQCQSIDEIDCFESDWGHIVPSDLEDSIEIRREYILARDAWIKISDNPNISEVERFLRRWSEVDEYGELAKSRYSELLETQKVELRVQSDKLKKEQELAADKICVRNGILAMTEQAEWLGSEDNETVITARNNIRRELHKIENISELNLSILLNEDGIKSKKDRLIRLIDQLNYEDNPIIHDIKEAFIIND